MLDFFGGNPYKSNRLPTTMAKDETQALILNFSLVRQTFFTPQPRKNSDAAGSKTRLP